MKVDQNEKRWRASDHAPRSRRDVKSKDVNAGREGEEGASQVTTVSFPRESLSAPLPDRRGNFL